MMNLTMGIEFDQESVDEFMDQLNYLLEKIKTLNVEIEKLNNSDISNLTNNINVSTLGYDEFDIQETAKLIKNIMDKQKQSGIDNTV